MDAALKQKIMKKMTALRLDEVDEVILRHVVDFPNMDLKALAEQLELKTDTIKKRVMKPKFQKALKEIRADSYELMMEAQKLAIRRLTKILKGGNDKLAIDAAKIVLAPLTNKAQIEVKNVQEVVYSTRFGERGEMISDKKEIQATTPKNTLELLKGGNLILDAETADQES